MPDYAKGKIYTIRCKYDTTLIYVGSTINPLYKRLGHHEDKSKSCPTRKTYSAINNDWENWYIEFYESYPCVNIEELTKREGEIIRMIGNLNTVIIGRTHLEWRQDHKEHVKQRDKKYYDTNKEKILEVCNFKIENKFCFFSIIILVRTGHIMRNMRRMKMNMNMKQGAGPNRCSEALLGFWLIITANMVRLLQQVAHACPRI